MSFEVYNSRLAGGRLPEHQRTDYCRMDRDLVPLVVAANQSITEFNRRRNMVTPFLHRQIMTRRRGRYSFRRQILEDGLHPTGETAREWRTILRRAVMMNRGEVARRQQHVRVRFQ
jgi:hypothetical protein